MEIKIVIMFMFVLVGIALLGAILMQWLWIEPDKTLIEIIKHTFLVRWYGRI